ncbi:MAG: phage tail protein [Methylocella sp.]
MGFLRQHQNPAAIIKYTGLQIQTSSNAVPIALLYGVNRLAPNAIWTGGFYAIPQYQKGGGKGGGHGQLQGYTYYTSFLLGLCEGPINGYDVTFLNQQWLWGLYGTGLEQATGGATPQAPWGYLQAFFPGQALGYNGLAYVGAFNFNLGSSPNLPQFSFVLSGITGVNNSIWAGNVVNGADSDPALIIQDFLTNAQYGVLFPAASIDATTLLGASGDSSYQTYCRASYLALSPVLTNQEAANSILARWLQLTNTAAVWSGGKLKFIPYGDTPVTGPTSIGNVTFNPNVTPIYNLTDDDFIHEDGKDPLEVVRSDPYASFNRQRLQINHRGNFYNATPIEAWDQNAIELYGLRMASDITASEICDPLVGQISAQLILQRGLSIRNTYNFKLSFEYCLLEPMDLVTVTDLGLGLSNVAIRIVAIEEDDAGLLSVTAEEFPGGTATAVQYPVQPNSPNSTNQAVVPARVNTPVIYEPPAVLTGGVAKIWAGASGGIASAYLLAETTEGTTHSTAQTVVASQPANVPGGATPNIIAFSVYAQASGTGANARSALRLNIFNGSATVGADFNLTGAGAFTADAGITATITQQTASPLWYQCQVSCPMALAGTPVLTILLENPYLMTSYSGTSGDGVFLWGAAYSAGSEPLVFLPAFATATGATYQPNGVTTPEGVSGVADPNWGGAFVWISTDGNTYAQAGTVSAPARQGFLTAALALPPGANPDTTDTLSVSLIESGGVLTSGTNADAQNGVTLCLVESELLAFATATLTGTNAYNLTYLYRGLYGTLALAHLNGAPFARLDSAIFSYPLPAAMIGVPLFLKFQSFNIFGQGIEDLSECTAYSYTPTGAGSPIGPVTQSLLNGASLDFRHASEIVSEKDQWGIVTDGILLASVDLGAGIP